MGLDHRLAILEGRAGGRSMMRDDDYLSMAQDLALFSRKAGIEPDPWQHDFLSCTDLRILLNIHRQGGKSICAAILAVHGAIFEPETLQLLVSPSLRQSGELFKKCAAVYEAMGRPVPADSETALTLLLENGSRIVSLPGKEGTIRGYSGVRRIIIDEAARVPDDLYRAVRPMLAVSGGQLIAMSTPWGQRGFWYDAWESTEPWRRFMVPATECPRITPAFLDEERRAMPEPWWQQEYCCRFSAMTGQIFPTDLIMSAFSDDIEPLFPEMEAAAATGQRRWDAPESYLRDDIRPLF